MVGLEKHNRSLILRRIHGAVGGKHFRYDSTHRQKHHVAAINWGFVTGKTQTDLPWDSWERPYVKTPPPVWFQDVLRADGKPYREREAEILRELTGKTPTAN